MIRISLACLLLSATPALAEPVSAWTGDPAGQLRLVDAGAGAAAGERLAAIAIRLEPGWKTYWRQPGATGVPPRFDFSGSANVASVAIAYPVPERLADETGVANVYHGAVSLPVTVRPKDPAQPVTLTLKADYGVCDQVCIPAHADATLTLAPGGGSAGPAAQEAHAALLSAPKPAPLGGAGPLAIRSVTRAPGPALVVSVTAPAGAIALFAETGGGEFVPAPEAIADPTPGEARFRIALDDTAPPPSGLRLTLAAGGRAIETAVPLDAIGAAP